MHQFLSDAWFAAARQLAGKYIDEIPDVPVKVRANQIITDVPFGDGDIHTHLDTSSGRPVLEQGHLDKPDVTVTTDYVTAKSMLIDQDQDAAMQAFMGGRIKIQGDMTKLLMLQSAPRSERAAQAAQELKAITIL